MVQLLVVFVLFVYSSLRTLSVVNWPSIGRQFDQLLYRIDPSIQEHPGYACVASRDRSQLPSAPFGQNVRSSSWSFYGRSLVVMTSKSPLNSSTLYFIDEMMWHCCLPRLFVKLFLVLNSNNSMELIMFLLGIRGDCCCFCRLGRFDVNKWDVVLIGWETNHVHVRQNGETGTSCYKSNLRQLIQSAKSSRGRWKDRR